MPTPPAAVTSASVSSGKGTRGIVTPVIHAPVNDKAASSEATAISADGGAVNKSKDEGVVPPSKKSGKKKQQAKDISGKISEGNKDRSVAKKKSGRK